MKKYKLQALMKKNGITFFNMSGLSLKKLLTAPDHISDYFKTTPKSVIRIWDKVKQFTSLIAYQV